MSRNFESTKIKLPMNYFFYLFVHHQRALCPDHHHNRESQREPWIGMKSPLTATVLGDSITTPSSAVMAPTE
jgi:hypothetical protein